MPADRFEMHDPNGAVVTILGSRGYDAHLPPVPLDHLARLELVVEPGRRPFDGAAVDVNDVLERVCHNALGQVGSKAAENGHADERT
jgi:hypothetical protein